MAAVRRCDILDSSPDGSFDRITTIAARCFNVPISIIGIVDHDRIWFKSHHGLPIGHPVAAPTCPARRRHRPPFARQPARHRGARPPLLRRRAIADQRRLHPRHALRHRPGAAAGWPGADRQPQMTRWACRLGSTRGTAAGPDLGCGWSRPLRSSLAATWPRVPTRLAAARASRLASLPNRFAYRPRLPPTKHPDLILQRMNAMLARPLIRRRR